MLGCGYEVVGCGWVGGYGVVVLGGRGKRSLVEESASGWVGSEIFSRQIWKIRRVSVDLAANSFTAKFSKAHYSKK